jgi:hypothetical protein
MARQEITFLQTEIESMSKRLEDLEGFLERIEANGVIPTRILLQNRTYQVQSAGVRIANC